MTTPEVIVGAVYAHNKNGKAYRVVETGRLDGTLEPHVVYKLTTANEYTTCCISPYRGFNERFTKVEQ